MDFLNSFKYILVFLNWILDVSSLDSESGLDIRAGVDPVKEMFSGLHKIWPEELAAGKHKVTALDRMKWLTTYENILTVRPGLQSQLLKQMEPIIAW